MSNRTRGIRYSSTLDSLPIWDESPVQPKTEPPEPDRQPFEGERALGKRVMVLLVFVAVFFLVVVIRLLHWQLQGPPSLADIRASPAVDPSRGRIVDRNGLLLVTDSFAWDVYASPDGVRKAKIGSALAVSLTQIIGTPADTIRASLATTLPLVSLAKDVSEAQREGIRTLSKQMQNPFLVWTDARRVRAYPQGTLAAHVLGFTNYEQRGVYGVEASYDAWLRADGQWPGQLSAASPHPLPDSWKVYLPSPGGRDLVLHLDAPLQHMAEKRLLEAVARYEAKSGAIIAMDPRTGAVLALANYPTFTPDRYSEVAPQTWVNAAVSDLYEPGSVFKLVTFAGGLDAGLITPDTILYDSGTLPLGDRVIRNSENRAYGEVTARQALARSLNVVSAQIALDLGSDAFYRYVRQFGFSRLTEIDLSGESYGIVKEPGNKYWSQFDQATNSFGQALSATALQMLNATAAIANNGTRMQPQIVRGLIEDGQIYELAPRVLGDAIRPEAALALTRMMVYAVDNSLNPKLVPGYRVAGKTGTAEIPTPSGYTSEETITSYVGFLPAANPQVVILVKLDKPKQQRWAEQVAMPAFGTFAQDAVRILRIQPDDRMP